MLARDAANELGDLAWTVVAAGIANLGREKQKLDQLRPDGKHCLPGRRKALHASTSIEIEQS